MSIKFKMSDSDMDLEDGPVIPREWGVDEPTQTTLPDPFSNIRAKIRYIKEHIDGHPGILMYIEQPGTFVINPHHPDIKVISIKAELNVSCWARITKTWPESVETRDVNMEECIASINWSLSTGTRHPETYVPVLRGKDAIRMRSVNSDLLKILTSLHGRISHLELNKVKY